MLIWLDEIGDADRLRVGGKAFVLARLRRAGLPVLVQRFVEARAAGVVFSRHPLDPGAMLVESHAGPGEGVVSGTVRPERYVLDRETGELRDGAPRGSLAADLHQVFLLARRAEDLLG